MPLLEQLTGCTMLYFYLHVGELWPRCLDKSQWSIACANAEKRS